MPSDEAQSPPKREAGPAPVEKARTVAVQLDPTGSVGTIVLADPASKGAIAGHGAHRGGKTRLPVLALLDVPSALSIADVLRILAPWRASIVQVRELASIEEVSTFDSENADGSGLDSSADLNLSSLSCPAVCDGYPVLLRCKDEGVAAEITEALGGKPLFSLEPDRVSTIERVHSIVGDTSKAVLAQVLGNCPICLEDLADAGADVVTRLCSHSFHSDCLIDCLSRCTVPRCPICRWAQPAPDASQCHDCAVQSSLWMCLVCGYLGCGRQQWHGSSEPLPAHGHALRHYEATGHAFAKSVDTEQVWNYSTDAYSQWLGQRDGTGGKLAEVPSDASPASADSHSAALMAADTASDPLLQIPEHERHETLALEYTYRLTTELEEARERYALEQRALEEAEQAEVEVVEEQLRQAKERSAQLRTLLERAGKQITSATKKAAENEAMVANAIERQKFEKGVADSIATNIPLLQENLARVESESKQRLEAIHGEVEALQQESEALLAELTATSDN